MSNLTTYSGLCETCDHDATCKLRRFSELPVIQCEEFSNQPVAEKTMPASERPKQADPAEIARMGLCANCLNVLSCGFPNARRGVLQCEEYILDQSGVVPPVQANYSQSAA